MFERQLPNLKFRYEGKYDTINFCIDSNSKKSKEEIISFLNSCSIEFLINNEGYIISL